MNLSSNCWTDYSITMANKATPIPDPEPLASLTQDTMQHIDNIKAELDKASKALESLEELGLDTSRMGEKINWGYKARGVILKTFGEKK